MSFINCTIGLLNACFPDIKDIAKRWENLRRSHRRHLNNAKKTLRSGSAAADDLYTDDDDSDSNLWDLMSFLEPYIKIQPTLSNLVSLCSVNSTSVKSFTFV